MAKADPLGSKPSGVWADRRPGRPKGSSASANRAFRLLLLAIAQSLVCSSMLPHRRTPAGGEQCCAS